MKKILIVEDQPELKVEMLLKLLEADKIKFEYEIVKSVTSAKRYLHKRANEVDVIIMDLGLPTFDGELVTNLLEGVHLIYDLEDFDVKVPVVINSTTSIPNFERQKADWEMMGLEIYKTDFILNMRQWFVKFLSE
ncbi:MAG: response regulator transcription factor [Clostridia bacterium]|nr:response regulator transcription factor [Clostridia bacterium]